MNSSVLLPPENVRGMLSLDKSAFTKTQKVPTIIDGTSLHYVITILKAYLLKCEKFKPVQINESNKDEKIIYLNPNLISDFNSFPNDVRVFLKESGISESDFNFRDITLTYDNWKAHDIICSILPPSLSFSGFSTVGSITHLNLKNELLPYKYVIAQVLLEKMKNCETVVNKLKSIENTFRNFEMEVLAGRDDLQTVVKENGCKFELNFGEVYWNPRLHEEHGRIIDKLKKTDVLYDVFCGIGPFVIPAAKNGCEVLANDLNPACCKWLRRNMVINKVMDSIAVFNESGDVFIKRDLKDDLLKRVKNIKNDDTRFHITMNLPATAFTFLPNFIGMYDEDELKMFADHQLPIVHLYCFVKNKENSKTEAMKLVEQTLNVNITNNIVEVVNVRNVAPNKEMIRVSFVLTKEVLVKQTSSNKRCLEDISSTDIKKLKLKEI